MRESAAACAPDQASPFVCRLACILALLASGGCAEDSLRADDLAGRTFLLQTASGFEPVVNATVSLNFTDMALYVRTGCDSLNFSYALHDDRIEVLPGGATKVKCDVALEQQDKWVQSFVRSGPRIRLRGSELTLTGDDASLVFVDRDVVEPARPFAGTTWLVSGISGEDESASVEISEGNPTMLFREDGTFVADTTCNGGTGRYRIKGGQLTVLESNFEERVCTGLPGLADRGMKSFLGSARVGLDPVEVLIEGEVLMLREYDLQLGAYAQ